MWYLYVTAVLFLAFTLRLFYLFIRDEDPFIRYKKGDVGHLLELWGVAFLMCLLWPISVTVLTVLKLREYYSGKREKGKGINLNR